MTTFGTILENALHETVERVVGEKKYSVPKYSIHDLLDDRFQFKDESQELGAFKSLEGYDEVS